MPGALVKKSLSRGLQQGEIRHKWYDKRDEENHCGTLHWGKRMAIIGITIISLIMQCAAVIYSCRLISITGHTRAWGFLSAGIATMAVRRIIALYLMVSNPGSLQIADYSFEFVGLVGSAMMLGGVLLIKPVFIAVRNAEEKQRALSESLQESLDQIRMLKELLPICASCKKIRDESGCWHGVEEYISEHTATKFSHGLCPECLRMIYPDYCDKIT
jgi:hypothetical protein